MYEGYEEFCGPLERLQDNELPHPCGDEKISFDVMLELHRRYVGLVEEAAKRKDWDTAYHAMRVLQGNSAIFAGSLEDYASDKVKDDAATLR